MSIRRNILSLFVSIWLYSRILLNNSMENSIFHHSLSQFSIFSQGFKIFFENSWRLQCQVRRETSRFFHTKVQHFLTNHNDTRFSSKVISSIINHNKPLNAIPLCLKLGGNKYCSAVRPPLVRVFLFPEVAAPVQEKDCRLTLVYFNDGMSLQRRILGSAVLQMYDNFILFIF